MNLNRRKFLSVLGVAAGVAIANSPEKLPAVVRRPTETKAKENTSATQPFSEFKDSQVESAIEYQNSLRELVSRGVSVPRTLFVEVGSW